MTIKALKRFEDPGVHLNGIEKIWSRSLLRITGLIGFLLCPMVMALPVWIYTCRIWIQADEEYAARGGVSRDHRNAMGFGCLSVPIAGAGVLGFAFLFDIMGTAVALEWHFRFVGLLFPVVGFSLTHWSASLREQRIR
tara:strand:+ start:127 stop:540 length:414 start_codon:yes stop_codon:yes gene_type:complete